MCNELKKNHALWIEIMSEFMAETEKQSIKLKKPVCKIAEKQLMANPSIIIEIKKLLVEDYRLAKECNNTCDLLEPYRKRSEVSSEQILKCLTGNTNYDEYQDLWEGIFV